MRRPSREAIVGTLLAAAVGLALAARYAPYLYAEYLFDWHGQLPSPSPKSAAPVTGHWFNDYFVVEPRDSGDTPGSTAGGRVGDFAPRPRPVRGLFPHPAVSGSQSANLASRRSLPALFSQKELSVTSRRRFLARRRPASIYRIRVEEFPPATGGGSRTAVHCATRLTIGMPKRGFDFVL
jgi:hypothetical protein